MSLTVGTNSYISVADADAYFAGRLHSTAWTGATSPNKEAALIQAARMLNEHFFFYGHIADEEQSLRWPREDVYDADERLLADDEIPAQIEKAACEQAIYLLGLDPTRKPTLTMQGFKTASVGPMSVEADKSMRPDMICPAAIAAVGCLGYPQNGAVAGGAGSGQLIRN